MTWIWIAAAVLVLLAGLRHLHRLRSARPPHGPPAVDDDALREILRTGRLSAPEEDEPLDMEEADEAEEEFWGETWDEPEEYPR